MTLAPDLHVLLIEDDEDDFLLAREVFEEIPERTVELEWVESYEAAFERLERGGVDICFVDYRMGASSGLEFIQQVRKTDAFTPLVLLTGLGHRDLDIAATKVGASDFIDKSELDPRLLERTIRYSMAHAAAMRSIAQKTGLLKTTLECASAGIAALEPDGSCSAINSRFEAMLAQLLDSSDPPDSNALSGIISEHVDRPLSAETGDSVELVGANGNTYAISRTPTPHQGAVYVSVDITAQKRAQEAMLSAQRDAEATSRARSSFFANVSHELRTPLHAIIGFSDLILKTGTPECEEYARMVNDSGKNLLEIINTVILHSRIEAGQHEFDNKVIHDLEFFIRDVVRTTEATIGERGLSVKFEVAPEIFAVRADQVALQTMIANLVSNAIDFSPEGGCIEIGASRAEDNALILTVRDHGSGIDPDDLEKVFDAFYQVDGMLDRAHEGIGLGLPLVRLLARGHGGDVSLQSELGQGTTARIVLPDACVERDDPALLLARA